MENRREMTPQQAFQRLAALCARGEHCEHDLEEKMRQWGLDEQARAEVMQRLTEGRYVDDERFARAFVRDKVVYNRWGRRKVEQALWAKRIADDTARRVLDEVDDSLYADALRPLLRQRQRTTKAADDRELRQKLVKAALSRGFTMDIIRQCMETGDEDEYME